MYVYIVLIIDVIVNNIIYILNNVNINLKY